MILYAYRIAVLSFVAFFVFDILRPGFVSYYFSPLWLLIPVFSLFGLALYKGVEKRGWLWIDKFIVFGFWILLLISQREELAGLFVPVLICSLLIALLLPSLLTSTYSEEYER